MVLLFLLLAFWVLSAIFAVALCVQAAQADRDEERLPARIETPTVSLGRFARLAP